MRAFRSCDLAATVLLLFTAAGTNASAQVGDTSASELLQKAKAALPQKRADGERLLREALMVPGQSPGVYADTAITLATVLLGDQRQPEEIRTLAQTALRFYTQSGAEDGKTALALEVLAKVPEGGADPAELEATSARARELRLRVIESLQAPMGTAQADKEPRSITPEITPPGIRQKVEPSYTEAARLAKIQGPVLASIVIDEQGRVRHFKILRGLGFGLDESAFQAVAQWQFEPARLKGEAIPVTARVEMNFRLL